MIIVESTCEGNVFWTPATTIAEARTIMADKLTQGNSDVRILADKDDL